MAWAVALESMDRELEVLERSLAAGGAAGLDLEALPLPARRELGPLPVDLLERAADVQVRMSRLEQDMALALHRARASLGLADRFGAAGSPPRFLDTRG